MSAWIRRIEKSISSWLHVLHIKNGVLLVYENAHREDADASITCPKNALLYILMNHVRALDGVPMEGNAELITLFAQSMNQILVQGTVPFNMIDPEFFPGRIIPTAVFNRINQQRNKRRHHDGR